MKEKNKHIISWSITLIFVGIFLFTSFFQIGPYWPGHNKLPMIAYIIMWVLCAAASTGVIYGMYKMFGVIFRAIKELKKYIHMFLWITKDDLVKRKISKMEEETRRIENEKILL